MTDHYQVLTDLTVVSLVIFAENAIHIKMESPERSSAGEDCLGHEGILNLLENLINHQTRKLLSYLTVEFYRYHHGSRMEANTFCASWHDAGVRIFQYSLLQMGGYYDVRVPGWNPEKVQSSVCPGNW